MLLAASVRTDIAGYVAAVFTVFIIVILVYILANLMFSFGLRPPYSRALDVVLDFLRDVSEPYLRLFRRFIPPIGMIDLSPVVAIIVLYIIERVIVDAIHG